MKPNNEANLTPEDLVFTYEVRWKLFKGGGVTKQGVIAKYTHRGEPPFEHADEVIPDLANGTHIDKHAEHYNKKEFVEVERRDYMSHSKQLQFKQFNASFDDVYGMVVNYRKEHDKL
jgi:hypothetical protein